ncbi:ECF-type sigma factor [Alkalimonas sp.]|uniref:ECF-type sigma factor n=1 Tax=Alkalimonas sp. TaxID=1872453 RepID=UPI00263B9F02|nr:ECF-type sigma factor [Alkalimonas sp.]MCC5827404.1 hypothetical protein [Alkalimonas sp.]
MPVVSPPSNAVAQAAHLFDSPDVYFLVKQLARQHKTAVCDAELDWHSTTALVHEVYLKLQQNQVALIRDDERQLLRQLSQVCRCVIIDLVRKQQAEKRQQQDEEQPTAALDMKLLQLDKVLTELEQHYPEQTQAALLYYFGKLKRDDIAKVQEVSPRTVDNYLSFIRTAVKAELLST